MVPFDISLTARRQQALIDRYFTIDADAWREIYRRDDVYAIVHQHRRALVHSLADRLDLPPGSPVLEVGCGAGSTSVAFAEKGFTVTAVDRVDAMIHLTRKAAQEAGVGRRIIVSIGDASELSFPDSSFNVVLAIGVLPWLSSIQKPVSEMARVLKPGGSLIVTTDNAWALHRLLDPKTNVLLSPVRRAAGRALDCVRARKPSPAHIMCSNSALDAALARCGLLKLEGVTLGFGPFSLFDRNILPPEMGARLHFAMQRLADRGAPLLRAMGGQYLAVARKN